MQRVGHVCGVKVRTNAALSLSAEPYQIRNGPLLWPFAAMIRKDGAKPDMAYLSRWFGWTDCQA
jgi:hypothetical protein